LITGSQDKTVALWDTRNLSQKICSLKKHDDDVTQAKFSRQQVNIIASSSSDRRVLLWDLSRLGKEQTEEEKIDGPPELVFMHAGHTANIRDISWNPNERLTLASIADDNILQVW